MNIKQTIINELKSSEKSRYRISKETGLDQAQLCRLLKGRDIKTPTADILLEYFGYKLQK